MAAKRFSANALAAAQRRGSAASSLSVSNGSPSNHSHISAASGGWGGSTSDEVSQGSVLEGHKLHESPEQTRSEMPGPEAKPSLSLTATPNTPVQSNYPLVSMPAVDNSPLIAPPSQSPLQTNEQLDHTSQSDSRVNTLPPPRSVLNRMPGSFQEEEDEGMTEPPLQIHEEHHDRAFGFIGRMKKLIVG